MKWKLLGKEEILSTIPFNVERLDLAHPDTGKALSHPFHRLTCPDWVNILPITSSGEAVLVEQSRAGSLTTTWEIPGGMVDPGEEALEAARRELEEETGYRSSRFYKLGAINPNPAIMANTVSMYLALDCQIPAERGLFPDENEDLKVVLQPTDELLSLVLNRKIDSALAALTIMLALEQLRANSIT